MDFWKVVVGRFSVRDFDTSVGVSEGEIDRILTAGIRAPTAGNRQPWHIYVVRDVGVREKLVSAAYNQAFIAQAPVTLVICADAEQSAARYGSRGRELYCLQDTAAAIENILLASVALGLGACWVGAFDEKSAAQALDLPGRLRPVAIVPIGKPAQIEATTRTRRRPIQSVVSYIG
jgi:nitroreductase